MAIVQVPTPSGGLSKITSGSFTTVSTVDIDNVFSTSYKNYFVTFSTIGSTSSADLLMQFRYGSSTETAAEYYYGIGASTYTATSNNSGGGGSTSCLLSLDSGATDRETRGALWFGGVGQSSTNEAIYQGTVMNTNSPMIHYVGGFPLTARIYTGFRLLPSTGTITGEYAVYGLAI